MRIQVTIFTASILVYWLYYSAALYRGAVRQTRTLGTPEKIGFFVQCPRVSVILAARDEAESLPRALESLLTLDYPDYEVIAVDDRSTDDTGKVIENYCARSDKIKKVRVEKLPAGWLGKTHALFQGYKRADGEWLLFTDADVVFESGALRAAVWDAMTHKRGHLALFPKLETAQYLEAAFSNYFALTFNFRYRPWKAKNPKSKAYVGIGAFNLVQRNAYERAGTHQRIALDVADDMALGKIVKEAGASSEGLYGSQFISVRWVKGVSGVMKALHKNAFRGLNYSVLYLLLATAGLIIVDIVPFAAAAALEGWPRYFSIGAVALIFSLYAAAYARQPSRYFTFWTHPLIAALFIFILWRSAFSALWGGGVVWRGTRYALKDLKKGMV